MNDNIQKVLVTGASGFLGREVVNELQAAGNYEVCGLIGKTSEINSAGKIPLENISKADISEKIPLENISKADISDYTTLERHKNSFKNTGTVIHTAGLAHQFGRVTEADFWRVNVKGTENVCRLALEIGVSHFVLISSVSVYGDHGNAEVDESFECRPSGFYAESKLVSEARAKDFCRVNGMRLTVIRPATIIGEGDRGNTLRLIKMIDKKRFVWIGDGNNKKSLIYKKDAARGILRAIESPNGDESEIYNLTAQAVSMKDIVSAVAENLQLKTPRLKIPENLVRGFFRLNRTPFSNEYLKKFENTFEKWLSDDIFSVKKFNEQFNFEPETAISKALERQVDYYLKHQKQKI